MQNITINTITWVNGRTRLNQTNMNKIEDDLNLIAAKVNELVDYANANPHTTLATVATTGSYDDLIDKPSIPAAQVQSDWNQTNNAAVDYIKNKPTIPAAPVQSDWNQTNNASLDYIKNKPDIPAAQVQSDWTEGDDTKKSFIKNKPNLATVATSGSYTDLSNQPSIPDPQVQSDWSQSDSTKVDYIKGKPTLAAVATSGSYNDLTDKPTQVQANWNQADNTKVDYIKNKPTIPAAQIQSDWNQADNTKLDYIKNKPSIPAAQVQSDWSQSDNTKADFIKNKPSIPTDTNDLTNGAGYVTGSYVEANPATTTGTLTGLKVNGVSYAVPQGGGGGGMTNPMTASGDIIYGGAAGAPSRLPKGTNGQVLTLADGIPSWQTPQSGGMSNPMDAAGDIIVGAASGAPAKLAKGTDGQVLTLESGTPAWKTPASPGMENPMNAAGDIIVGGSSGAPAKLAKGTDGKVLKMVSGSPAWADDATGVTDVTVGGTSVVSGGVAAVPAIPTVPTNVSAFNNDAGYLTAHQSIKTLDGDTLTGSGSLKTGKLEKLAVGSIAGGDATVVTSAMLDRYSSLLLTGHSQYADTYEQVWTVDVADIKNGTVTLHRSIPGWQDQLNLYLFLDSGYLRWNGGSNHTIYMTSIVGMCPTN